MRKIVVRSGQIAVTVLVTWFMADRLGLGLEDLAALGPQWWRPTPVLFVGACLVLFLGNLASGLVWGRMVRDLCGVRLPAGTAIRLFLVANLGRYVPGKLWQIAGLALLARRRGVPGVAATTAAVLGHVTSLVAASIIGSLAFLGTGSIGLSAVLPVIAGVGLLTLVAATTPALGRIRSLADRLSGGRITSVDLGPRVLLTWVGLLLANWGIYAVSFYALAKSYGVAGAPVQVGSAFVAAYVLGYVAIFAPAGIGVREIALAGLLTPVMGAPAATGLSVVARVWTTVVEVAAGGLLWGRELALEVPTPGGEVLNHE